MFTAYKIDFVFAVRFASRPCRSSSRTARNYFYNIQQHNNKWVRIYINQLPQQLASLSPTSQTQNAVVYI